MIGKTISYSRVVEKLGEGEIEVMHNTEGMRLKLEVIDEYFRHSC